MLSTCSTTQLHSQPKLYIFLWIMGLHAEETRVESGIEQRFVKKIMAVVDLSLNVKTIYRLCL